MTIIIWNIDVGIRQMAELRTPIGRYELNIEKISEMKTQ